MLVKVEIIQSSKICPCIIRLGCEQLGISIYGEAKVHYEDIENEHIF